MLKIENLSFSYKNKKIIENLSYEFPQKGVVAIMGPSGCGKSTLLRLIAGLEKPQGGCIKKEGKLSVAFQEPRLLPTQNCLENLLFVKNDITSANEFIKEMELESAANLLPDALSGGMKQRLSLTRALHFGGDILLFDEPFSALDEPLKERLTPRILQAAKNALLVIVTHDEQDAKRLGATVLRCEKRPITAFL